jgi:hypothetical protein
MTRVFGRLATDAGLTAKNESKPSLALEIESKCH